MGDPGVVAGRLHAVMRAQRVVTRGQVRTGVIIEVATSRRHAVAAMLGPGAAVSMGTISLAQMLRRGSGGRRSLAGLLAGRRCSSFSRRYAVAVLNPALAPAIAGLWVSRSFMYSLLWQSVRWRPVKHGVLHWREVAVLTGRPRLPGGTVPQRLAPPPVFPLQSGCALPPRTPPRPFLS